MKNKFMLYLQLALSAIFLGASLVFTARGFMLPHYGMMAIGTVFSLLLSYILYIDINKLRN